MLLQKIDRTNDPPYISYLLLKITINIVTSKCYHKNIVNYIKPLVFRKLSLYAVMFKVSIKALVFLGR